MRTLSLAVGLIGVSLASSAGAVTISVDTARSFVGTMGGGYTNPLGVTDPNTWISAPINGSYYLGGTDPSDPAYKLGDTGLAQDWSYTLNGLENGLYTVIVYGLFDITNNLGVTRRTTLDPTLNGADVDPFAEGDLIGDIDWEAYTFEVTTGSLTLRNFVSLENRSPQTVPTISGFQVTNEYDPLPAVPLPAGLLLLISGMFAFPLLRKRSV